MSERKGRERAVRYRTAAIVCVVILLVFVSYLLIPKSTSLTVDEGSADDSPSALAKTSSQARYVFCGKEHSFVVTRDEVLVLALPDDRFPEDIARWQLRVAKGWGWSYSYYLQADGQSDLPLKPTRWQPCVS